MEKMPEPLDEVCEIEDKNKLNLDQIESSGIISVVGSIVVVEDSGENTRFRLVEDYDLINAPIDDAHNISIKAPVGAALLGHKSGEVVEYTTHTGKNFSMTVIEVL